MAPGETDVDRALRAVLLCAFYYAGPNTINIVSKHQAIIDSYEKHANLLCDAARTLRELDKRYLDEPEVKEHADAIERAAAWCKQQTVSLREMFTDPDTPMIERDYGHRREMGYCDMLVRETAFMYGTPLRGTVAKIATVALESKFEITAHHVRDWIEGLRRVRTRYSTKA